MKKIICCTVALLFALALLPICRVQAEGEGRVYLSVSRICFTVAGETENIYIGTAPAEDIVWKSSDENVISVENGVLTANRAGKAVITADYQDQHWQCEAECLADDRAALESISWDILLQPKRYPAQTGYDPIPAFADAGLLGDSISLIFSQNEAQSNQLGHPRFLVRGGSSINGFVNHYWDLYHRGQVTPVEVVVQDYGLGKLFIMMGQNDLGYKTVEETLDNYAILLSDIRSLSPDIEIYIQTCSQEFAGFDSFNSRNLKIYEFNDRLPAFAEEQGCYLVDVAPYLECHMQRLAPCYSLDQGIHVNYDGCLVWGQVLSNYMELQQIRREGT